jgi:signal peptidase I
VDWKIKLIIIVIAIPIAVMMWPSFLGGTTDLFMVEGQSMLPTILPGSIVITKKQPTYELDDIVAYHLTEGKLGKIVVHRIIDHTENGYVIKGDNNPTQDPGVFKEEKIIGRVVFSTPYVGYLVSLIRNPIVMVVASIGILLVQYQIKKRKKGGQKPVYRSHVMPSAQKSTPYAKVAQQKGPNYVLFFIASALNILVYIVQQIALANGKNLTGDFITRIIFSNLEGSIASSIGFAAYFGIFVLLYMYAKRKEENYVVRSTGAFSQRNMIKNSALKGIQVVWLLFVIMEFFHIITIIGALQAK